MTKEQLSDGSYFIIGRRIGAGVVAGVVATAITVYLGIHMELRDHRARLDMLERAASTVHADHDALTRVLVIQEQMAGQLKRIEGYLMERSERAPGR